MAVLGQEAQRQKESLQKKPEEIRLSVKDTDFILKNLMQSTFQGSDVEHAYKVMKKISELHRRHLES